ncbi:MAG: low affinity iron permease family protein [Syntrophobacteraceae bacterium]
MRNSFRKFARWTSDVVGAPWAFCFAFVIVVVWAATGSLFDYSDTWQLVINTGTTIVTFLMVFLIQNTQNRDSKAIHLKLDELISSIKEASDSMLNVEDLSDEELTHLHVHFEKLREKDQTGGLIALYETVRDEIEERKAIEEEDNATEKKRHAADEIPS